MKRVANRSNCRRRRRRPRPRRRPPPTLTAKPTAGPTPELTAKPTPEPTAKPTPEPTPAQAVKAEPEPEDQQLPPNKLFLRVALGALGPIAMLMVVLAVGLPRLGAPELGVPSPAIAIDSPRDVAPPPAPEPPRPRPLSKRPLPLSRRRQPLQRHRAVKTPMNLPPSTSRRYRRQRDLWSSGQASAANSMIGRAIRQTVRCRPGRCFSTPRSNRRAPPPFSIGGIRAIACSRR